MPTTNSRINKRDSKTENRVSLTRMMFLNHLRRSSRLFLFVAVLVCLYLVKSRHSDSTKKPESTLTDVASNKIVKKLNFVEKIFERNDRSPTYRFYAYEGYEFDVNRARAEAKLIDNLKVCDRCQQNPKTLVVDVGASFGEFGFYAAACGCQVYMFEIDPVKYELLKKSILLNSFQNRVKLSEKAVSDLPTDSEMLVSISKGTQMTPENFHGDLKDIYSTKTVRLSDVDFKGDIYLLHVDVGGQEIHVIRSGELLFHNSSVHHVLFQYTPMGTDRVNQNDLLSYMRDILKAQRLYALHPRQSVLFGPLYNEDIDQFYSQHHAVELQRDVYVMFMEDGVTIESKPYDFASSFD